MVTDTAHPQPIERRFLPRPHSGSYATADGGTVRLPTTPIQPIAAKDVAGAVAEVAAGAR
ncbi:hypothetical protein [Streptomyces sp. NPDC000851]